MNAINIDIHPDVDCLVRVSNDTSGRTIRILPHEPDNGAGVQAIGNRFTRSANGLVHDRETGLTWTDTVCDERVKHGKAVELVSNLTLGGYSDWRLPTIKELLSLVDYDRYDPAINVEAFPDTKSAPYWSSSAFAADSGGAWVVDFHGGYAYGFRRDYDGGFVRAVRGPAPASQ